MTKKNILPQSLALNTLFKYWKFDSFRPVQSEVVDTLLKGENLIALLPTGAGKSICFQVPGIAREGLTLVISPLVALMEDQVSQLQKRGIRAIFLHSGMHRYEIDRELDNVIYGNYDFLYISPERIHSEFFIARAPKMNLSLIAIDEAHCISQWGHDFRPSYTQLDILRTMFPKVPVGAFTATATKETLQDIRTYLGLEKAKVFRKSFAKENLSYTIIKSTEKARELFYLLERFKGSGIIYVRNRKYAENLAEDLYRESYSADYYHAGLSYQMRQKKQQAWISGENQIIVSTNAFGMGIDKADVRWVIHMDLPSSLEEYYQEAGRAGRDGKMAYAVMIYDDKDEQRSFEKLELSQVNHLVVNDMYDKLNRFLGIPMGGGFQQTIDFNLNDFSKEFNVAITQIIAVLKVLKDAGILIYTDSIFNPSTLFFKADREHILRSESRESPLYQFILTLVRHYEGTFSYPVKINEEVIARITGTDYKTTIQNLVKINALGLGVYKPRNDSPQITFLTDRTEARSLNVDYNSLDKLYENRSNKLEQLIAFIHTKECRETFILKYFGEMNSAKCDQCDICKGSANDSFTSKELHELHGFLIKKLKTSISIFDLLHWWPLNKRTKVLSMLSILENEKKIQLVNREIKLL